MPAPSFQELTAALAGLGWTLDGVEPPSSNTPKYTATGTGPDGVKKHTVEGPTPEFTLGSLVAFAQRHNQIRAYAALQKTGAWDLPWEHQLEEIGKAYGELPVFDPKAVPHWQALAQESKHQADAIRKQLKVSVTDDPEPYPHVGAMVHDIHHKQKFTVSRAHSDHPVWSVPDNVNFRIVHDVLGHGQTGGDFGWNGEQKACSIHFPMLSRVARPALFTECVGQTAYALRKGSHGFGQQKIGTLPQFLDPVEKMNGEHVYIPHGKFAYPEEIMGQDGGNAAAWGWYQDPQTGIWKQDPNATDTSEQRQSSRERIVVADVASDLRDPETGEKLWDDEHQMFRGEDPNASYVTPPDVTAQAGMAGHPDFNGDVVRAGSPSDYLDRTGTYQNTAKMVVPWWERDSNGAWKYPVKDQDKIILNALRVCLLSPLKHLKWNAAHYQAIKDMPVTATGREMWDKLDNIRRQHNKAQGFDPDEHLSYYKEIKVLAGYIQYETGDHKQEALKQAKQQVFSKVQEFEQELTAQHAQGTLKLEGTPGEWVGQDEDTDENGITPLRIYLTAHQMVDEWLRGLLAERSPQSHADRPEQEQMTLARLRKEAAGLDEDIRVRQGQGGPILYEGPRSGANDALTALMEQQGRSSLEDLWTEAVDPDAWMKDLGWKQAAEQMGLEGVTPTRQRGKKNEKYAGFMGQHLDNIEKVAHYIPELRQAALKDIYTDGGRGFTFRNAFMNLKREHGITGVNPKVISFVWLMLYPEGSDLGIVDTHVARAFNRKYNDVGQLKDYYKLERMQRAMKDATGYPDMPLGTYHHGMWDMVRTKDWRKGWHHSDHSPLAVDNPEPWDQHPWDMDTGNAKQGNWIGPEPWERTRPLAENVAGRYEAQFAGQARAQVPYAVLEDMAQQKAAAVEPEEWYQAPSFKAGDIVRFAWSTGTSPEHFQFINGEVLGEAKGPRGPQYRVKTPQATYGNIEPEQNRMTLVHGGAAPNFDFSPFEPDSPEAIDGMVRNASPQINFGDGSQAGDWGLDDDDFEDFVGEQAGVGRADLSAVPTEMTDRLKSEWDARTAATDPDYTFVFYQGGLVVEPCSGHPNIKDMAGRLLKDFGFPSATDHDNGPGTDDMRRWSAGDVWGEGDHIQITQLSDPEVADDARQAVRAYFESDHDEDGHAVVVTPDDGEWEVQEPKTGGWMPVDPDSPHGGYANTGDVVCNQCGKRTPNQRSCENCEQPLDGTEQPVVAGPYDPFDDRMQDREKTAVTKRSAKPFKFDEGWEEEPEQPAQEESEHPLPVSGQPWHDEAWQTKQGEVEPPYGDALAVDYMHMPVAYHPDKGAFVGWPGQSHMLEEGRGYTNDDAGLTGMEGIGQYQGTANVIGNQYTVQWPRFPVPEEAKQHIHKQIVENAEGARKVAWDNWNENGGEDHYQKEMAEKLRMRQLAVLRRWREQSKAHEKAWLAEHPEVEPGNWSAYMRSPEWEAWREANPMPFDPEHPNTTAKTAFFGRGRDPEAETKRLEWENGMSNEIPPGTNVLDTNNCPHCGRPKSPGSDFCPICQHSYDEQPDPEVQKQYGIHPSQYPDHVVQGFIKNTLPLYQGRGRGLGGGFPRQMYDWLYSRLSPEMQKKYDYDSANFPSTSYLTPERMNMPWWYGEAFGGRGGGNDKIGTKEQPLSRPNSGYWIDNKGQMRPWVKPEPQQQQWSTAKTQVGTQHDPAAEEALDWEMEEEPEAEVKDWTLA